MIKRPSREWPPAPTRADLNNMWREKILGTVERDFAAEFGATGDDRQRRELRALFARVRDWIATKADGHFLERRSFDSPKFVIHDVALRDEETARRIDRLPEAFLPMDRAFDRVAESLRLSVEHRKPGPEPSREGVRQFIEVGLEYEIKRLREDAADVMSRTSWLGRMLLGDQLSGHRARIAELKASLREIVAERELIGRYSPAVSRRYDAAMADWEQARVRHRNQTTMLAKVEAARDLPLVERGNQVMNLITSFDRLAMRREASWMREGLQERPAFISLPDKESEEEEEEG